MREFDIFKYLKHWKISVIFALVFAIAVGYFFNSRQEIKTTVNLRYTHPDIEEGRYPDGTKVNIDEIYSADVISRIIDDLHLGSQNTAMSTETLRNHIKVEPIIPEDKQALIDGASTHGEEYVYNPVEYKITLTNQTDLLSKSDAIKVVSRLIDVYIEKYSTDHMTRSTIPAIPVNLSYDYLDKVELLYKSVSSMETFLAEMSNVDDSFRSNSTGYCFTDLVDIYKECRDNDIKLLYAQILSETATVDVDVLINNYKNRITNCKLDIEDKKTELNKLKLLLDSYIEKAKEQNSIGNLLNNGDYGTGTRTSNSTDDSDYYVGNGYVLQDLYGRYRNEQFDYTTTYDETIAKYADLTKEMNDLNTEIEYCNYILDVFSHYKKGQVSKSIDESFDTLDKKLDNLYSTAKATLADYDAVTGAKDVEASGIVQSEQYNLKIFIAIGGVSGFVLGLIFLIVFGRIKDIFTAYKQKEAEEAEAEEAKEAEEAEEAEEADETSSDAHDKVTSENT